MKENIIFAFLLFCDGLIPLTALIGGLWLIKYGKRTKGGIGYCSRWSLKTEETWRFAQGCCGMIWEMVGIATLVPSLMFGVLAYFVDIKIQCIITLVLVAVQLVILWLGTLSVERSLKEHFDEDGNPIRIEPIKESEEESADERGITIKEMIFGISDEEEKNE